MNRYSRHSYSLNCQAYQIVRNISAIRRNKMLAQRQCISEVKRPVRVDSPRPQPKPHYRFFGTSACARPILRGVVSAIAFAGTLTSVPSSVLAQTIDLGQLVQQAFGALLRDTAKGLKDLEKGLPVVRQQLDEMSRGKIPQSLRPTIAERKQQEEMLQIALEFRRLVDDHGPAKIKCGVVNKLEQFEREYPKLLEHTVYVGAATEIVATARGIVMARGAYADDIGWAGIKVLCGQLPPQVAPLLVMSSLPIQSGEVPQAKR